MSQGVIAPMPDAVAEKHHAWVRDVYSVEARTALVDHPEFAGLAIRLLDGWKPVPGDRTAFSRHLRDLGQFMSAVWAIQLHASPSGLTHTSLMKLFEPLTVGSRTRVAALLAYLQLVGMIRALPKSTDRRVKAYAPAPALVELFRVRYLRELTLCLGLAPQLAPAIAVWDRPGVVEAFTAAQGRILIAGFAAIKDGGPGLSLFSQRKQGLTLLGQIMVDACPDGRFPPAGPLRLNLADLARRVEISRAHCGHIVDAGRKAGFFIGLPNGETALSELLVRNVRDLVATYVLTLAWCAEQVTAER